MNTAQQSVVSVLTPVYNGAQFLAECIESVLGQTYQFWDYTIVNNCSTDQTLEIAQRYAARDRRIRIHNNTEFLPVVANHNEALRHISPESKYCKLIFADDWLYSDCLEKMVALAETHPSVGIVTSYGLRGSEVMWTGLPFPSTVVSGRDACRQRLMNGPYVFGTGTSHMFRADLVRSRDPFYNESNLHCDSESCFQVLQISDLGFIHQILHYSRAPRADSFTTLAHNLGTVEAMTLYELITYGPVYLSAAEYPEYFEKKIAEYYAFLATVLVSRSNAWSFHKEKWREFGLTLDRVRLVKAVLAKGINGVLKHPKRTIKQLMDGTSVLSSRPRAMPPSEPGVMKEHDEER
jgi:glycosyltransferase involved in cell wall biosynthesis